MLEYWKRKEKKIALQRGMLDYEDNEVDRPGNFIIQHIYRYYIL